MYIYRNPRDPFCY